ncbi:MAG: hypothetical protein LUQ36_08465 [Methanoregula sp.]|nr:hypothetical protein [Methanoregula sp.]
MPDSTSILIRQSPRPDDSQPVDFGCIEVLPSFFTAGSYHRSCHNGNGYWLTRHLPGSILETGCPEINN